jgi:succinate-acetate transporter protein
MTMASIRLNAAVLGMFVGISVTLGVLTVALYLDGSKLFIRIAGGTGAVTSVLVWYNAMAELWNYENSWISLPVGMFPWSEKARASSANLGERGDKDYDFL